MDAIVKALETITGLDITVLNLAMRSISLGEDAQGEASMRALFRPFSRLAATISSTPSPAENLTGSGAARVA